MSKLNKAHHIVILAGGPSAEREVSLATGAAIETALKALDYQVTMIDPNSDLCRQLNQLNPDLVFN
ncbi:MAG: D-alanine--D-alanine ligase, partial [Myxococcales bacterium]|nr:D-alanine--D-alanine ligase [Myxococcales bacterium]